MNCVFLRKITMLLAFTVLFSTVTPVIASATEDVVHISSSASASSNTGNRGADGQDGQSGQDGQDGQDGRNGQDAYAGASVSNIVVGKEVTTIKVETVETSEGGTTTTEVETETSSPVLTEIDGEVSGEIHTKEQKRDLLERLFEAVESLQQTIYAYAKYLF